MEEDVIQIVYLLTLQPVVASGRGIAVIAGGGIVVCCEVAEGRSFAEEARGVQQWEG